MEVVYRLGRAPAAEVRGAIDDPPSYSSIRAMLRILEDKGHLRHEQDGPRYVYKPTVSAERAKSSILQDVVRRLFDGSTEQAVAALLDNADTRLRPDELERLSRMIDGARRQGR